MKKLELELLTREVTLIRAALNARMFLMRTDSASIYRQLADHMEPIGYYEFSPDEAACICLALNDYAETVRLIGGLVKQGLEAKVLADAFMQYLFEYFSIEQASDMLKLERERRDAFAEAI